MESVSVVYTYAKRGLKDTTKQELDKASREFEEKAEADGIQSKYLNLLKEMEVKYGTANS